jgi:ankyrin repeat protein
MPVTGRPKAVPRWKFLSACKDGDVDVVRKYVETADHRAYLQDDSALNSAVCYNHPDILLILLEAGTDPNIHGEHVPALHVAAANDNVEAAKILISHGAKIDVRDTVNNDTALIYGIRDGKFRVAELLLEAGADPNLTDRRGFTPLHIAVARNDAELVQRLLDHGAAINVRTRSDGRTPLIIAAAAGFEKMVEMLLSRGADPSITDSGGKSPLERAVECHRSGAAEILKKVSSPPKRSPTTTK